MARDTGAPKRLENTSHEIYGSLVREWDSLKQHHASVVYQRSKINFVDGDACQATITYEITSVQVELNLMCVWAFDV